MTKLWLLGLAASAALVPMAAAQAAQTVPDPDPFYGLPTVSLKTSGAPVRAAATPRAVARAEPAATPAAPAAAGVTWHEPARVVRTVRTPAPVVRDMRAPRVDMPAMPPMAAQAMAGHAMPGHPMAGRGPVREVRNVIVRRGAPPAEIRRELRRVSGYSHAGAGHFEMRRRIDRGGFIPPMWMGPQFVISNWGMYGFRQPMPGGRWIRYYDDALMIDRDGRVLDGRYGMDWDRYGDRWDDRDGVPVYAGDYDDYGDYDDGYGRDEDWDEGDYRDGRHGDHDRVVYRHGGDDCAGGPRMPRVCGAPPPPPQAGYGYGYSYGGCGCGPVVITETTTTTVPVMETRTYYETVRERVPAPRRYRAPARRRMAPPPPPPPPYDGERG